MKSARAPIAMPCYRTICDNIAPDVIALSVCHFDVSVCLYLHVVSSWISRWARTVYLPAVQVVFERKDCPEDSLGTGEGLVNRVDVRCETLTEQIVA